MNNSVNSFCECHDQVSCLEGVAICQLNANEAVHRYLYGENSGMKRTG